MKPIRSAAVTILVLALASCRGPAPDQPPPVSPTTPVPTATTPAPTTSPPPVTAPPSPVPSTAPPSAAPSLPASLLGRDIERIPTSNRVVALTFDAGANADAVGSILTTL